MKSLTKDEILSLYVDKVSELKKFIRLGYMNEDTDIFKDITELEILETVMGYNNELKEEEINET